MHTHTYTRTPPKHRPQAQGLSPHAQLWSMRHISVPSVPQVSYNTGEEGDLVSSSCPL